MPAPRPSTTFGEQANAYQPSLARGFLLLRYGSEWRVESLRVRAALQTDIAGIGAIAEQNDMFAAGLVDAMIAGYLDRTRTDLWLVSASTKQVVGFAFCEPERMTSGTWSLLAIGVLPELHGEGVGSALLRNLESRLRGDHQRILLVETLGTPEFDRTRRFYRARGFAVEARIRDFYEDGGDKIIFRKRL